MKSPERMDINENSIPAELKTEKRWCMWRWVERDGKFTKPPFQVSGKFAKTDDSTTWTDYQSAINAYKNGGKFDGIGYMLSGSGLVGLDFDDCIDAEGDTQLATAELIYGIDSYTEKSPSGTGYKTLVRGEISGNDHHKKFDDIELGIFQKKRYFCITGQSVSSVSKKIEHRQKEIDNLIRRFWPCDFEPSEQSKQSERKPLELSDQDLIDKACNANDGGKFRALWAGDVSGYDSQSEADLALCCKLAFWTRKDAGRIERLFRSSGLMRDKWNREKYAKATINEALALTTKVYEPPPSNEKSDEQPKADEQKKEKASEKPSCFQFIHNAEILKNLKPIEWRIEDVLVEKCFYYNFGDSGHYKTFVELDRNLCIAAGIDYHGHQVKQGTVFYIAGEGQQGIGRRIAAWHAAHGTKANDVPFFVSMTATQLMDPGAVDDVRKAIDWMAKEYGPPALVVIDTLARNFGEGDENSTKDMNRVISNMDMAFRNDFMRSLNHHTGLMNKDRARGSYALHCASDGAFRISLTADDRVLVECKKMKDAKPSLPMLFDRREVLLIIGDTPDASFVLDLAAEGDQALELAKSAQPETVTGKTGEALDILRGIYSACLSNLEQGGRAGSSAHVTVETWKKACFSKGLFGARNYNFNRAADNLLKKGLIRYDTTAIHVYPIELFEQL